MTRLLVFDSGVGGLSVARTIREAIPAVEMTYVADDAGFPYGEREEGELTAHIVGLMDRLVDRFAPDAVVIACNTASTIALGMVREVLHVPIVGTVPAIRPAASMTSTGTIGLLGTAATIRQAYVDKLQAEFAADKRLIRFAAPDLVSAAETKLRGGRVDAGVFADAVAGLRSQPGGAEIDTVVLACTHFPLVEAELAAEFGPGVRFVHGAQGIARRIAFLTGDKEFSRERPDFALYTGDGSQFDTLLPALATYGLDHADPF